MKGVWLEDLTWAEARARFDRGDAVVIPVGAAARAHGLHLPLGTGALIARALGQRLIERLPVIMAPVVGLGADPAFAAFAGSQSLSRDTFAQVMREIIGGFCRQGVRRLVILDADGSCSEGALGELDDVLVLQSPLMGRAAEHLIEHTAGGPADERETSVVLALAPRSVRMDVLAASDDFAATAAMGDPTRASAFKGERLMAAVVEDVMQAVIARWPNLIA